MRATVLGLIALLCGACAEPQRPPPERARRPVIVASFQPLFWMARILAGPDAEVHLLPPADVDPAHWRPDDAAIRRAWAADLILINGADFEGWTGTVSLPISRVVDTSAPLRPLLRRASAHHHGPGADHGVDPHLWLDPQLARRQLEGVARRMAQLLPHVEITARRARIEAALDRIEADLRALGQRGADRPLLANHQAFDYLAARAGLQVHSLDVAPDAPPEAAAPACAAAKRHGAGIMLWEAAPSAALSDALTRCGVVSVVLRPLERPPVEGDHERAHRSDLAKLSAALSAQDR